MVINKTNFIKDTLKLICLSSVYLISYLLYKFSWNEIAGMLLIIYSILQYIYTVKKSHNLVDLKAIFILTWFFTLGLAMLRLLGYQPKWTDEFFLAEFIGIITLFIAIDIGHCFIKGSKGDIREKYLNAPFNKKVYYLVLICTGIAIICFILNYIKVGFIAISEDAANAYVKNASKFLTIEVGMAPISGIAYYCITREGITVRKKIIMWVAIALNMIIFPLLNLSRGNLIANVCMFLPVYFMCTKNLKKSLVRIGIIVIIAVVFLTTKRDFSQSYAGLLIPKEYSDAQDLMMSYAYLTCSHDNFALNITSFSKYTNGLRMFNIFNEILDIQWVIDELKASGVKWVNAFLNTQDMFAFFYYDIGYFGIVLWSAMWGIFWGITEKKFRTSHSPITCIVYGITFYCVAFAFFSSKTGFVIAMWYGMTYLCHLFMKICFKRG